MVWAVFPIASSELICTASAAQEVKKAPPPMSPSLE
jgi:hypothetical protein